MGTSELTLWVVGGGAWVMRTGKEKSAGKEVDGVGAGSLRMFGPGKGEGVVRPSSQSGLTCIEIFSPTAS